VVKAQVLGEVVAQILSMAEAGVEEDIMRAEAEVTLKAEVGEEATEGQAEAAVVVQAADLEPPLSSLCRWVPEEALALGVRILVTSLLTREDVVEE
jgi:hypothetical protein